MIVCGHWHLHHCHVRIANTGARDQAAAAACIDERTVVLVEELRWRQNRSAQQQTVTVRSQSVAMMTGIQQTVLAMLLLRMPTGYVIFTEAVIVGTASAGDRSIAEAQLLSMLQRQRHGGLTAAAAATRFRVVGLVQRATLVVTFVGCIAPNAQISVSCADIGKANALVDSG